MYEYDSKTNRELAKTAMEIYTRSHTPSTSVRRGQLNESAESLQEMAIKTKIDGLILEYVSDVVVLAEQTIGRQLNEMEIDAFGRYVVSTIDGLGEEGRMRMVSELTNMYEMGGDGAGIEKPDQVIDPRQGGPKPKEDPSGGTDLPPDIQALLNAWGTDNAEFDFNGDGNVDGADLAILLARLS
tara:strand:+ start:146 stop:697 length:552 start_codon:yes stop_codon:yes gene_type:complete